MNTVGPDCYLTTSASVDRWRAQAGQDGIAAWCRLHNLDPNQTLPEITIHGGLVQGQRYVATVAGRRTTLPWSRTLIAPPPPCALEVAA